MPSFDESCIIDLYTKLQEDLDFLLQDYEIKLCQVAVNKFDFSGLNTSVPLKIQGIKTILQKHYEDCKESIINHIDEREKDLETNNNYITSNVILLQSKVRQWLVHKRIAPILKRKKQRDLVIKEIYYSEIIYHDNLELITKLYIPSLDGSISSQRRICTPQTIQSIFSNIELILNLSSELLSRMDEVDLVSDSHPHFGDIFLKLIPFFKLYTEYVNNFDYAIG